MTGQQEDQIQEEEKHGYNLVRGTKERVVGLYDQAKEFSPLLKNGLLKVESSIPADYINRFAAASEPVIDELDIQLDRVIKHPVQEVAGAIAAVPTAVLAATGEKVDQLRSIQGDLSKQAAVRLEKALVALRDFSAHRGKEILHFDLIEYSQEVLDNASTVAKPLYEPIQKNLANAVIKLNAALVSLKETATARSADLKGTAAARSADLNARLQTAVTAAREVSATSKAYVQQKYMTAVEQLPDEQRLQELSKGLPYPVRDAVQVILHSPQLFLDVKSKADLSTSKRTIDNLNNLMAAVKEVVFAPSLVELEDEEAEPNLQGPESPGGHTQL